MRYTRSSQLFLEAQQVIPGGVNSPVRAFKSVGGTPVFIKKADKSYLYDEDGNVYIDYISSWGPLIYGHAYPPVVEAIKARVRNGTSFGAPTKVETTTAELLVGMVPNIDKVRFVNSGTEACMSAVRLARGFTKRNKIIKFEGCYHGHSDAFLVQAGSGVATFGIPDSAGVTQGTTQDTLLAQYNNLESVNQVFKSNKDTIAAVIIEPIAGNMGCIPPKEGFLRGLRALCDEYDALLILDEVMTGFRLASGGAQETASIKADIVTFGKIIGGGLPVGAFASRNEIMDRLAPIGDVYQAGTLSGNPLAMSAGLAILTALHSDIDIYKRLKNKTNYLSEAFDSIMKKSKIDYQINQCGSMISIHFTASEVINFQAAITGNNETFKKFFHGMLKEGIYLPPSAFESWFLNDALTQDDLNKTITAFEKVIKTL